MNCEIISNIKPEVTSPIPSCRRGTITTARACTHPVLPLQGESEGVTRKVGRLPRKGFRLYVVIIITNYSFLITNY